MILDVIKLSKEDFVNQNNILRRVSEEVISFENVFQNMLDNMIETFENCNAAGLSAPQVGIYKKFAVINLYTKEEHNYLIIVNPEIISLTGSKKAKKEACLSLPGFRGNVFRKTKLKLRYQDRFGKVHEGDFQDFQARVILHEIDHLNGILYVDRMRPNDQLEKKEISNTNVEINE